MSEDLSIAAGQLRAYVERIERIEAEIAEANADKSEIYKEARAEGFDVKTIRKVVAKRKIEEADRDEQDSLFDMYWSALHGTPSRVHVHVREEPSPRKAAEAVSERTAEQVASESEAAEAGVSGQPETIPALTGQFPGTNVSGREEAGVTAGETAIFSQRKPYALRPNCQDRENCGGYGAKHCHKCTVAASLAEEAA